MTQIELASFQVSRRALPWLLAAVIASVLPHVQHVPWWLLVVMTVCVGWRWAVHRGLLSYPPRRLQALFAAALAAGVFLHYRTLAGHQAGTAMLLAMFALKLLEMYKERDAYVVILIGYFVAATAFLFHFQLLMAFYVMFVALLFTAALVAINTSLSVPRTEPFRRAGWLLLQSIPLALVLFVVMPRIGPMWAMGVKPSEVRTGVGEEMSPGSIGELALSDELAFRVEFSGPVPAASALYWRGLTLTDFDGRTWRQSTDIDRYSSLVWYRNSPRRPDWLLRMDAGIAALPERKPLEYSIYLEPTQRPWLFALPVPVSVDHVDAGLAYDQRLRARAPVKVLTRYRVVSLEGLPRDVDAPEWLLTDNLQLPPGSNPRAFQWALQQRAEVDNDADYVQRVLRMFRDQEFVYTLQPDRLGAQPVDAFLFESRRGFCEHYAGAFVFLMRAAGIPARVVAGYQGGERNPYGNTLEVRQYDAHAWAEIWQPGRGWIEIDPTSWVSPERISDGTRQALSDERKALGGSSLAEALLGDTFQTLRGAFAFLNHRWNAWVLGFDEGAQQGLLKNWLGSLSPYRIGMFVLGTGLLVVGVLVLWMFRGSLFRRDDPVTREYRRFCAAWAARGNPRASGEGPLDYGERLRAADPGRAGAVTRFIAQYVQLAYGGKTADALALRRLREARAAAV